MCGKQTEDLTPVQIEGSKLQVCSNCESFGTVLHDEKKKQEKGKKQEKSSKSSSKPTKSKGSKKSSNKSKTGRNDMFDKMETLASDYDQLVRQGRESKGMTQEDLADQLNEKLSLISKIENGDMRPSENVRKKLESTLEINLTEEVGEETWDSGDDSGGYTLGDIVKRKDK